MCAMERQTGLLVAAAPHRDVSSDAFAGALHSRAPINVRKTRRHRAETLWHDSGFRSLWIGQTSSQIGSQLTMLALPLLAIQGLGADESELGLLSACQTVAFLLVSLPAGVLVDRWRRRSVLVVSDLVRAILYVSIPIAWSLNYLSLVQLMVVAVLSGVCAVFFDVAYQSYLPDLVDKDQVLSGNTKLQASQSFAQVAGPAAAGLLLRLADASVIIAFDALSFVCSALFIGRIRHFENRSRDARDSGMWSAIIEGMRFIVGHPLLRRIVLCGALSNLSSSMYYTPLTLYMIRDFGFSAAGVGAVFSVSFVGGLIGSVITGALVRMLGRGLVLLLSASFSPVTIALAPLASVVSADLRFSMLAIAGFGFNISVAVFNVTQISFRQQECPPEMLSRANASIRFALFGTLPIGSLAGGFFAAKLGIPGALWISTGGLALAALPIVSSSLFRGRVINPSDEDSRPRPGGGRHRRVAEAGGTDSRRPLRDVVPPQTLGCTKKGRSSHRRTK
jgi:MFS family permease